MKRRVSQVTLLLSCAVSAAAHAGEESIRLIDGVGRDPTAAHCAICHSLDYIEMNAPVMNRAGWEKTVQKMIARFGAPIDEAAARDILDYLTAHYSEPKPAP
jgi:sulfite dehydrogenase (cytochrome) subunit B